LWFQNMTSTGLESVTALVEDEYVTRA